MNEADNGIASCIAVKCEIVYHMNCVFKCHATAKAIPAFLHLTNHPQLHATTMAYKMRLSKLPIH